ncbi:MAG: insulinase family protein, partial [Rhodothermales bacterium]|nr:insulinase family protein [Rhodothermales bacterium]
MTYMFRRHFAAGSAVTLLLLLLTIAALPTTVNAQEAMPMDSTYTVGTLANGLTYFIRENQRPENRAALWLAVNAGSILEEDDQQGLAHFLEHMAFNGTRDFEKQELVDYLESIGMRFGPDLNAYTSFDETVYMLEVPTDSLEVLDQALLIMENWASGITLDEEEIEKERGVVLEEMRAGKGAQARVRDKQFPTLLKGSAYPDRIPIGTEEVLSTAPTEAFRRFYERWYRPDNMAVIAVGDFDASDIERRITERFSGIARPESPLDRPDHPIPAHDETLVTVISDPELTSTSFVVYNLFPKRTATTEADNRRAFVEGVYHGMLNLRFAELRQEPDAPFLFAGSGSGSMVRATDAHVQSAQAKEGRVLESLEKVLTEIERVDRFGFTESEIERARTNVLRGLESALAEKDKRPSARHASEALTHFLTGAALPGLEFNVEQARRELPTITIEEVNALARQTTSQGSRVIAVTGPDKEDVTLPTEEELLAVFDTVRADTSIVPWEDNVLEQPLVSERPRLGIVVRERTHPDIGVTEWELRNGVRVVMKPTDFQNDEVLLRAFSPGGTSLADDEAYNTARFATSVVSAGGLADFDPIQLGKALTGKIASASTSVGGFEESVRGRASPEDLETMFQLLYLKFTQPRLDSVRAHVYL